MAEALIYQSEDCVLDYTPVVAASAGEVRQQANGLAAVIPTDLAASQKGAAQVEGIAIIAKTTGIVFLDGGRVYWDYSANAAHFRKVNDQDFYVGRAFGDATSASTTMYVLLNSDPPYDIDINRDPVLSVPTGTQAVGGFGYPKRLGGCNMLELTATSEAQCIDMLSVDRFSKDANAIIEAVIRVPTNGTGAAVDFNVGIANGTSTTDADAVTEHVFFHIDGGSLAINAQSKDGTTTVTATDTTKVFTAGTAVANKVELWIDTRNTSNVLLYVEGVAVLTGSTFKINAATGPFGLLAHLEKSTGTTTGQYVIDRLTARLSDQ